MAANRPAPVEHGDPSPAPLRDTLVPMANPSKPNHKGKIRGIPPPGTFKNEAKFLTEEGTKITRRHNSKYSLPMARRICEQIMAKKTLTEICQDPRMPNLQTVTRWFSNPKMYEFREMYYFARRVQAEMLIDEILTISDDVGGDWKRTYDKKGLANGWIPDTEAIQRSRVRIDTRKWFAAKMVPRIYGDQVQVDLDVTGDLAEMLKNASNNDDGLPDAIDVTPS